LILVSVNLPLRRAHQLHFQIGILDFTEYGCTRMNGHPHRQGVTTRTSSPQILQESKFEAVTERRLVFSVHSSAGRHLADDSQHRLFDRSELGLEAADTKTDDRVEPLRHPPGLREKVPRGTKRRFALSAEQKLLTR
jgi:hypothetical protein